MPESPTSEPESAFVCDCEEWMGTACAGLPFYEEREGKRYCVLHAPNRGKRVDFDKAVQQKLRKNDFNFQGVRFSDEVSFSNVTFAFRANFPSATFSEK